MKKIYTFAFALSVIFVLASFAALAKYGLVLGVDFRGGSTLEVKFTQERASIEEVRNALNGAGILKEANISLVGSDTVLIRAQELSEADHQKVLEVLQKNFMEKGIREERFDSVGPIIGQELKSKSITAIVITLIAVSLYIAFVFRKMSRVLSPWVMSFATLVALAHDIIIPLGIFALMGHYMGVEISAVFVAAVLTILGYSISDTVVVFDRTRENIIRGRLGQVSFGEVVHRSIMQTLVRSLNTTFTTLLSLVAIYIFGGESIKYFALALILGIGLGAYSSIFVASPLLVWLSKPRR